MGGMARSVKKAGSTAEDVSCKALVACQNPEPPHLTYLRERWLEAHPSLGPSESESGSGSSEEEGGGVNPLLLDPTQWKEQDHYAILGLGKLRYRASAEDIKKAYRQKVLTHHPDKQTEEQQKEGDDHFKCIKIAYDILGNPKKRRSYDSVDPTFDDAIPPNSTLSRESFYTIFTSVFAENSRWSTRQPVPQLGDENSSISEVERFYAFWYDFESWREFSYQDEENPEKGECREERRWIEKQNKAVRQKKKKEEMGRLRALVDTAYSCDPRVKQFKEAEKAEKEAKKRAKLEASKKEAALKKEEERRKQEEARLRREKEEEEARAQAARVKREKEAQKKAIRKERKNLRAACKEHEYFAETDVELVSRMQDLDRLCSALSLEELRQLNTQFSQSPSPSEAKTLFEAKISELDRLEQEKLQSSVPTPSASATEVATAKGSDWTPEETQLLVKAVNLFPAGTVRRWDTVAGFINTHSSSTEGRKEKDAKMVIAKVKALQRLEAEHKASLNKQAFSQFEQQHRAKDGKEVAQQPQATPSERYDTPKPWTAEEQKMLEQALRTHPASLGAERWRLIAETVGSRTKEECVARFKELVARVKAKKQSNSTSQQTK